MGSLVINYSDTQWAIIYQGPALFKHQGYKMITTTYDFMKKSLSFNTYTRFPPFLL